MRGGREQSDNPVELIFAAAWWRAGRQYPRADHSLQWPWSSSWSFSLQCMGHFH